MKKILLIFVGMMLGISAFAQNTKETTKSDVKSDVPKKQQIEALEDLIRRAGENHEESIKAKAMIATLRKEEFEEEQKRMSETLSPAEYDAWKIKYMAKQNASQSINKTEEKK